MSLPELDLLFQLDKLFHEYFTSPRRPRYGISVTDAAPDLSTIHVELRFLKDHSYCCAQPDCHIPHKSDRLIRLAAEHSIHLPEGVAIHWHCIIEEGARLQCLSALGRSTECKSYEFDHVTGGPENSNKTSHSSPPNPPPDFTGLWTVADPHGGRSETEYVAGLPNGVYRRWLQNGTCIREGFKKNGQWHGKLITRSRDGTVLDVSEFTDGTGTYRIFNANGQLANETPLRHGRPHGPAKRWCLGKLVETRHYVNGLCIASNVE